MNGRESVDFKQAESTLSGKLLFFDTHVILDPVSRIFSFHASANDESSESQTQKTCGNDNSSEDCHDFSIDFFLSAVVVVPETIFVPVLTVSLVIR